MDYNTVLNFWFKELKPQNWFEKSSTLDLTIKTRFLGLHKKACAGELYEWRRAPVGRLAEIIVLDQFSRNMFRDTPHMFSQDTLALVLAQEAVLRGADRFFNSSQKSFLYMPFMHSESKRIHKHAVQLYSQPGLESNLEYELKHKSIIDHFGRYPHRNKVLGRDSTYEEVEFLKKPDSSF